METPQYKRKYAYENNNAPVYTQGSNYRAIASALSGNQSANTALQDAKLLQNVTNTGMKMYNDIQNANVDEAINPGYFRRMERRAKKENNQKFFMRPQGF